MHFEVKLVGFGGQGIILAGNILGRAVSLYDQRHAVVTTSYGPEARGGACASTVIIDDKPISYPYSHEPDILIAMSQDGYNKFIDSLKPNGKLLIDTDLVQVEPVQIATKNLKLSSIPATRIAEELGNKIIANIVMLGFFTAETGIVSCEAVQSAVIDTIKPKHRELNIKAFGSGFNYSKQQQ